MTLAEDGGRISREPVAGKDDTGLAEPSVDFDLPGGSNSDACCDEVVSDPSGEGGNAITPPRSLGVWSSLDLLLLCGA